jgi:CDGSH-type Zn-finger protein
MSRRVVIKCMEDGPYIVEVDGDVKMALCRCGGSNNKPYCDGTHSKIGFKAPGGELEV